MRILRRRPPLGATGQALRAADDLVADGDPLAAIRLLTEANRAQRDRSIEHQLVKLRFDAFRTMSWSRTRPVWPESVEDLFPGERIPEVDVEQLTTENVRSAIANHGSLLVRGLVDPDRVGRLTSDIDLAFDCYDAQAAGEKRADVAGWYERFEPDRISDRARKRKGGTMTAVESPPTLFDLIETLDHVGLSELARLYFGEPPMILARKATLRRLSPTATGGWHQDGAFMGANIRSLNVWLSLTHCGDDAPGLDIVGRRLDYLVETGDSAAPKSGSGYANWGVSPANAELAAAGTVVRPIFEPGDALIFDQLCLHRTGRDASMTKGRYAIETWLFAPSTYGDMTTPLDDGYSPRDQLPIVL